MIHSGFGAKLEFLHNYETKLFQQFCTNPLLSDTQDCIIYMCSNTKQEENNTGLCPVLKSQLCIFHVYMKVKCCYDNVANDYQDTQAHPQHVKVKLNKLQIYTDSILGPKKSHFSYIHLTEISLLELFTWNCIQNLHNLHNFPMFTCVKILTATKMHIRVQLYLQSATFR